jgi:hypothetical protein
MSAVIRIKRRITDERHEAFVLNCKKRKTDGTEEITESAETSTVLKFAGTVNQVSMSKKQEFKPKTDVEIWNLQDTNITEHIAKLSKDEAREIVSRKRTESNVKSRMDQNREKSQQNRFKIVNYTRELSETAEKTPNLTIVDVENQTTATTSAQTSSSYTDISDESFVYDLYIADTDSTDLQYPDTIDLNDLRLVVLDEVYCSYYAYMWSFTNSQFHIMPSFYRVLVLKVIFSSRCTRKTYAN